MSNYVTTSAPDAPPLVEDVSRLVVEVATKYQGNGRPDHSDPQWLRIPEVTCEEIDEGEGAEPSSCDILVPRSISRRLSELTSSHIPPVPDTTQYEDDPTHSFYVAKFPMRCLVRVVVDELAPTGNRSGTWAGGPSEAVDANTVQKVATRVVFIGNVLLWEWELETEQVILHAYDFRWRMHKMKFYGMIYYYGAGGTPAPSETKIIRPHLPVFNRGGLPDRYIHVNDVKEQVESIAFGPSHFNTADGASPRDATKSYSAFFTVGHAVEHLLRHFSDFFGFGTIAGWLSYDGPTAADKFLEVPDVWSGSYPGLFDAADPGDALEAALPMQGKEINIAGAPFGVALDHLLARAAQSVSGIYGAHGWKLVPVQGTGARSDPALQRLEIFNSASPPVSLDLYLPEFGESVAAMPRRDIIGGSVVLSGETYRNRLIAFGGRKKIQTSFSTVDGTLKPAWSTAEQTAFRVAAAAGTTNLIEEFPRPYLEWGLDRATDFVGGNFTAGGIDPGATGIGDGEWLPGEKHLFQAKLVQKLLSIADQDDIPVKLNVLIWRSTDAGLHWEKLPTGVQVTLRDDAPIFRLGPAVRPDSEFGHINGVELPWTYDPTGADYEPAYDILITVTLVADDHLEVLDDATSAEYPLEEVHQAEREYLYEAVSQARTLDYETFVGGVPDEILKGSGTPETTLDDTNRLGAVVRRKAGALGQYPITGSPVLSGFVRRFPVGTRVRAIRTSAGFKGLRGPYFIMASVRGVHHRFGAEWTTALTLEGLPR